MLLALQGGGQDFVCGRARGVGLRFANGYEAAAAIRALGTDWSQRIPIIAMTVNAYADDVQLAFDAGMNAHVSKPIDIKIVEKTILEFKK